MMITLRVAGVPAPQGSKNVSRSGHTYESSKKVKPWREAVIKQVVDDGHYDRMLGIDLHVKCVFHFARPKYHYYSGRRSDVLRDNAPMYVATTPDIDKLLRSTFDALTKSRLILDDKIIVSQQSLKVYSSDGWSGADITITDIGWPW